MRDQCRRRRRAPILPCWQIEIEVPVIFLDPRDTPSVGGVGDITVGSKVLVWRSLERPAALAVGVEGCFPSGSERRGLGGEAAVEPFLTFGVALGDFDVLASAAYEFNVNANVQGPTSKSSARRPRSDGECIVSLRRSWN
jgi:outer membrane putative beta-barrel porin/alpha-amylase